MVKNEGILLPRVREALQQHGLTAKAVPCTSETASAEGFCTAYGYPIEQATKTLVFSSQTNPKRYVACLALATTRKLDINKGLTAVSEVPKLRRGQDVEAITGMEIGGITLPGLPEEWPLCVDKGVMESELIIMGGGNLTSKLVLAPVELLKLPDVRVAELAQPHQPPQPELPSL